MVLKSDGYSSDHIRLNRFVFWSSAISIGIFGLLFVLFPEKSQFWLTYVQVQVNHFLGGITCWLLCCVWVLLVGSLFQK